MLIVYYRISVTSIMIITYMWVFKTYLDNIKIQEHSLDEHPHERCKQKVMSCYCCGDTQFVVCLCKFSSDLKQTNYSSLFKEKGIRNSCAMKLFFLSGLICLEMNS